MSRSAMRRRTAAFHPPTGIAGTVVPWNALVCCACFNHLVLGPEHKALKVKWNPDPGAGSLRFADGCGQHVHVDWGKYEDGTAVLGFGCCCPTIENERFVLWDDGTIHAEPAPWLAIGLTEDGRKLCLVNTNTSPSNPLPRRLIFKRVLD